MSGKMFTFPEKTKTAYLRLTIPTQDFSAVTVCFRSVTDLSRPHSLFSLATPSASNGFLIYKNADSNVIDFYVGNKMAQFGAQNYKLNMWHSICSTWDSASGLVQLWLDGKPSIKKFTGGQNITQPIHVCYLFIFYHNSLQKQDSHGGRLT
ncbi:hypothetical protein L3Q82_013199 [Scortum barcoo]|uniref:Uncharacterized protein n=1 Tax=Scortum barcoo TaxID=214431 RepID=A0ACB8VZW2_9TELE|nr:hypothetical protein L3Q82_013199 [Scortum barcoo]